MAKRRYTMPTLHQDFVSSTVIAPYLNAPAYERWWYVITHLPAVRNRRIYDDMTDVYTSAYNSEDYHVIEAALTLTLLQELFFSMLHNNKVNLQHVNVWGFSQSRYWNAKIGEKIIQSKRGRVTKKREYVPPTVTSSPVHDWLH